MKRRVLPPSFSPGIYAAFDTIGFYATKNVQNRGKGELANMNEDQKRALIAVLNLLIIDCNQLKLKVTAAERVLTKDPDLQRQYQSVLQSLRDDPSITNTEQAFALLRQNLFPQ